MRNKDDDRLRHKLENKLSNQGIRAPCRLSVDVYQQSVTLTGIVMYDYQKRAAIQSARSMDGVSSVIDRIKVQPPVQRWDESETMPHHQPPSEDSSESAEAQPPEEPA